MNSRLLGFWSLQSWRKVFPDGHSEDYASSPIAGFLHYSREGTMAVSIFKRTTAEILSTYGGAFFFDGQSVRHEPWEGWSPEGLDKAKVRHLKFFAQSMRMETDWIHDETAAYRYRLEWHKREGQTLPADDLYDGLSGDPSRKDYL